MQIQELSFAEIESVSGGRVSDFPAWLSEQWDAAKAGIAAGWEAVKESNAHYNSF